MAPQFRGSISSRTLTSGEFETRVIQTWGRRLRTSSTQDGRFVQVEMPTNTGSKMQMVIDRKEQTLTYNGDENLKDNWYRIVQILDSIPKPLPSGQVLHTSLLTSEKADLPYIRRLATMMGLLQEDQEGQANPQNPPGTVLPSEQEGDDNQLSGRITIIQDPETGMIGLAGVNPEDIDKLKK